MKIEKCYIHEHVYVCIYVYIYIYIHICVVVISAVLHTINVVLRVCWCRWVLLDSGNKNKNLYSL